MEHKFITSGEIMLRLTPPDYEKIQTGRQLLRRDMGEVRQMLLLSLANLGDR